MIERRELYRSANGDAWFLGREPADGRAFIIHQPNAPSGGRLTHIELGDFLRRESKGPEQQALLRLIANPGERATIHLKEGLHASSAAGRP
jgi:hypothetical protein